MWFWQKRQVGSTDDNTIDSATPRSYFDAGEVPFEQAKAEVEIVLAQDLFFDCTPARCHLDDRADGLNLSMRDLLSRFDSIETSCGFYIGRSKMNHPEWRPEFLQIGDDDEQSAFILQSKEPIYFDPPASGKPNPAYASIYHWMLSEYMAM
jgi:hypothetical protein